MSDNTTDETDAQTLDWGDVKARENDKRQSTKTFRLEYPDGGVATFRYQMVENVSQLVREHSTEKPTRNGQDPKLEMDEDQEWAFAAALFQEAIVEAPDGFKPTEREIREGLTKPVVDEMTEAIVNYSTMDEETFIKFR